MEFDRPVRPLRSIPGDGGGCGEHFHPLEGVGNEVVEAGRALPRRQEENEVVGPAHHAHAVHHHQRLARELDP
ncbi:MAG TPA: hypothetical protein VF632_15770 [Longimicrobium sp.]|jgi:hypothetical protein